MLEQFHFQQPLWWFAVIPLALLWWFTARARLNNAKAWARVIDANLLPLLLGGSNTKDQTSGRLAKWLLAIGWLIATIALADPVWEKVPRPIFQTNAARIIVLDLSSSMLIADLKPSRLARARFKIEDILSDEFTKSEEGQIGLVLFAGDAFIASPLTRDSETIRALLQVLTPKIMPSQGSRVDLGLKKAQELLNQAGVNKGEILLIADGVSDQAVTLKAVRMLKNSGHRLSVLGVGSKQGGTLPNLKYRDGKAIIVKLEVENLKQIAQIGGGNYHLISTNNSDLKSVLAKAFTPNKLLEKSDDQKSEDWKSTGPFIILLLLPFAALAFRRGWLFSVVIAISLVGLVQPQPVMAEDLVTEKTNVLNNFWADLWSNKEQQADKALQSQEYDKARTLTKNPLMRGTVSYKQEKYDEALKNFKQAKGADARYNEGNTLAKVKKYKEAIEAYDKALKQQPNMEDAIKNKAIMEKLLKQQKKKEQNENKDQKNKKDGEKGEKKENNKGEKEGKDSKDEKNQFSDANKELDKNKDPKKQDGQKPSEKENEAEKNKSKEQAKDGKKESKDKKLEEEKKEKGTKSEAKELSKEEKMAAEQWLRRIPDDPGGLLRRKFQRQYQQRRRSINDADQPW